MGDWNALGIIPCRRVALTNKNPFLIIAFVRRLRMININGYELPEHVSYSAFTTFLDCGHLYFLTRVAQLEELPAWWFIGGSAVHEATEEYDRATV